MRRERAPASKECSRRVLPIHRTGRCRQEENGEEAVLPRQTLPLLGDLRLPSSALTTPLSSSKSLVWRLDFSVSFRLVFIPFFLFPTVEKRREKKSSNPPLQQQRHRGGHTHQGGSRRLQPLKKRVAQRRSRHPHFKTHHHHHHHTPSTSSTPSSSSSSSSLPTPSSTPLLSRFTCDIPREGREVYHLLCSRSPLRRPREEDEEQEAASRRLPLLARRDLFFVPPPLNRRSSSRQQRWRLPGFLSALQSK